MLFDKIIKNEASKLAEPGLAAQTGRLFYLDWLRVIAIISVFFYHCNRFFDYHNYPIQTSVRSLASTIHREFFQIWMMPLFFIISGAAVFYSLKSQRVGGFIGEKILRLLIPLVTIGIFIIAPPQVYLERLMNGQFIGTFFQWYPHYFHGIYPLGNFAFTGMHLWYLLELFFYSLILLPLFIPLGKTGRSIISRISNLFERPWALFLLFIPLAALNILADIIGLGMTRMMGGWDPLSYFVFLIYGYLIFSNTRIHDIIRKYSTKCLIATLILTSLYLYLEFGTNIPEISGVTRYNLLLRSYIVKGTIVPKISLAWAGILTLRSLLAWFWIISLLGLGARFLNLKNRFLAYANETVLPFYILHQTILLIIGYFVIQWTIGIAAKYLIITTTSFVVIMVIYELLVRRINVFRFLFGMKLNKSR